MLAVIVVLWLVGMRPARIGRLVSVLKRHKLVMVSLLWFAFAVFAVLFVLNFSYFEEIHDIDDAVDAAVNGVHDGLNPYAEDIIPRFKERYSPDPEWAYGPYNYLPLDLLVYFAAWGLLGGLGTPVWFVLANLVFSGIAMAVLRPLVRVKWTTFVPVAGTVMLFYSFDNASLTLLLMVLSVYAYRTNKTHPAFFAIVMMSLATLTKVYAAIPLLLLVLFELEKQLKGRNWRAASEIVIAACLSGVIALLLLVPFGVQTVLDSAVFFHTSGEAREGTSIGGTVLAEIAAESAYYAVLSIVLVLVALVVSFKLKSLNDRVLLVAVVFLLVSIKSSLAPLSVAGLFLVLSLRDRADERAKRSAEALGAAVPDRAKHD
jgi:hypothetical protein